MCINSESLLLADSLYTQDSVNDGYYLIKTHLAFFEQPVGATSSNGVLFL
jgi:hypothetical protein